MLYPFPPYFLFPLDSMPEGGMLFYWEQHYSLRGRTHMHTWFILFTGGEKTVAQFLIDMHITLNVYMLALKSWEVEHSHSVFVKLFPPPNIYMPVPSNFSGLYVEPACQNKEQAIVTLKTELTGKRKFARKFLFGMPASWIDGNQITPDARAIINARFSGLQDVFSEENTEFPYVWMKRNRYIDGSLHSELNPTNFWPIREYIVRQRLVKHLPPRSSFT